jgi:hypothetical protein
MSKARYNGDHHDMSKQSGDHADDLDAIHLDIDDRDAQVDDEGAFNKSHLGANGGEEESKGYSNKMDTKGEVNLMA